VGKTLKEILRPRELEVVDTLIMYGSQKNAAYALHIAVDTLKQHIHNAMRACQVDKSKFSPQVRLVYLRAKELGLL
jgi:DNA-binding NarL/FixJ family response regulator